LKIGKSELKRMPTLEEKQMLEIQMQGDRLLLQIMT
jgi:hypothetical protein